MKKRYRVIVTATAKNSLKDIVDYIKPDSPLAANKVKRTLIALMESLDEMPERFSKEEYLREKSGDYRSVTKWRYKIIYRIDESDVIVLNILHTSHHPDKIKNV